MDQIFIICSSADGHLGCFQFLALVHRAVTNTSQQASVSVIRCWVLCVCPRVVKLDLEVD